jgi:hypothetical protein
MDLVIKRENLVAILKENKNKHHTNFVEAVAKYKIKAVEVLKENIDNISSGKKLRIFFTLPVPEEHTKDYDRAIHSLELDARDEIKLTEQDARCYVDDQWGWSDSYFANTSSYNFAGKEETEED